MAPVSEDEESYFRCESVGREANRGSWRGYLDQNYRVVVVAAASDTIVVENDDVVVVVVALTPGTRRKAREAGADDAGVWRSCRRN